MAMQIRKRPRLYQTGHGTGKEELESCCEKCCAGLSCQNSRPPEDARAPRIPTLADRPSPIRNAQSSATRSSVRQQRGKAPVDRILGNSRCDRQWIPWPSGFSASRSSFHPFFSFHPQSPPTGSPPGPARSGYGVLRTADPLGGYSRVSCMPAICSGRWFGNGRSPVCRQRRITSRAACRFSGSRPGSLAA